jgi:hypothetical protein
MTDDRRQKTEERYFYATSTLTVQHVWDCQGFSVGSGRALYFLFCAQACQNAGQIRPCALGVIVLAVLFFGSFFWTSKRKEQNKPKTEKYLGLAY